MRSLITGIDGFVGSWLAQTLKARGDDVVGLTRKTGAPADGFRRCAADMRDADAVDRAVKESRPDRVFHLAAQNNIADSLTDPRATMETNVVGTIHLFDAVLRHAPDARVVSAGSSAEYGKTAAAAERLSEELPLTPTSPYGISKAAQSMLCAVYAAAKKLRVVHARPFAVIGPRKTRDALSHFCRGIVEIERDARTALPVGNLAAVRDFVDVRDCARALVLLSEAGEAGRVYNVCGSRATTMEEMLRILQGLASRPVKTERDPSRLRPVDDPRIVGDDSRLKALGYAPEYDLARTLKDTLAYWRTAPEAPSPRG
jgi:GDP-4-dehydro-6-deoxy-D-mannose reductase